MNKSQVSKVLGLTLIEVLITLVIFSLIGIAGYRILSTLTRVEQSNQQRSQLSASYYRAVTKLDSDIMQMISRPVRDQFGEPSATTVLDYESGFEFSSLNWLNPAKKPRSSVQRVHYNVGPHPHNDDPDSPYFGDEKNYLLRHYWLHLDGQSEEGKRTQALIADVSSLRWRIQVDEKWYSRWPPEEATRPSNFEVAIPSQVEVHIESDTAGVITRLMRVN